MFRTAFLFLVCAFVASGDTLITINVTGTAKHVFYPAGPGPDMPYSASITYDFAYNDPLSPQIAFVGGYYPVDTIFASDNNPAAEIMSSSLGSYARQFSVSDFPLTAGEGVLYMFGDSIQSSSEGFAGAYSLSLDSSNFNSGDPVLLDGAIDFSEPTSMSRLLHSIPVTTIPNLNDNDFVVAVPGSFIFNGNISTLSITLTETPEPSTGLLLLAAAGVGGLEKTRRSRKRV